jgi:protein-S-isoprenylcysteine O-methyltransferase Ste14
MNESPALQRTFDARSAYDRFYWPLKLLTAAALAVFAWRIVGEYRISGYWLLLAVLLGEVVVLALVLIAPRPTQVSVTPRSLFFTNVATFYFLVVSVKTGTQWLPPAVPGLLVLFGIFLQVAAKLTLGRCFGLLPAIRGIVVSGPYRVVRHPIYAGYFFTHLGFFLVATSWHNLFVYVGLYACQIMRILDEERLLAQTPSYAAYMQRVRWRMIPGVF